MNIKSILSSLLAIGTLLVAVPLVALNETASAEELIGRKIPSVVKHDHVTFADFNMNRSGNAIVVAARDTIMAEGYVKVSQSDGSIMTQVIIGIAGIGGQACAYNGLGIATGDITPVRVFFDAPDRPGTYEIRFRQTTNFTKDSGIEDYGTGGEPGPECTIGLIVVK